jgi:hypothetical protein
MLTTLQLKTIVKSVICQCRGYLQSPASFIFGFIIQIYFLSQSFLFITLRKKLESLSGKIVGQPNLTGFSDVIVFLAEAMPTVPSETSKHKVLNHSISVIIPSKDSRGEKINHGEMLLELSNLFARLYGGYSIFPGIGFWLSESGIVIQEDILKLQAFTNEIGFNESLKEVELFVLNMKIKYQQEAIAIVVDGEMHIH